VTAISGGDVSMPMIIRQKPEQPDYTKGAVTFTQQSRIKQKKELKHAATVTKNAK